MAGEDVHVETRTQRARVNGGTSVTHDGRLIARSPVEEQCRGRQLGVE
jgi:hypothetical protein